MLIKELRKRRGLSQTELANGLGIKYQAVQKWEKGENTPPSKKIPLLAHLLGVDASVLLSPPMSELDELLSSKIIREVSASELDDPFYIELPYISVPARAGFIEMVSSERGYGYSETCRVIVEPNTSYTDQVVIEVDGDSMEPYYPTGTKVRCKEVKAGDWPYLNSGVYAVSYANNFVIKRIRNNDFQKGFITLHSDNTETGGTSDVPITQLHHIWKVLRIVDAPAR